MPQVGVGSAYPTPGQPPSPGAYAPQGAYAPVGPQIPAVPPKKGLGAGAIVAIVLGGIAVVGVIAALVVFMVIPRFSTPEQPVVTPTPVEEPSVQPEPPPAAEIPEGVFSEALDAAQAEMPDDYVVELAEETDTRKVYWAGPPNSEWDTVIVVDKVPDGWRVTETTPFNESGGEPGGGDGGETGGTADDSAAAEKVVAQFLNAIKSDKTKESQRLTISPLREDPASAQITDGSFKKFTIDRTESEADGTFWVYTTQVWTYGTEKWRYDVVPTEAGLRIRNLEYVE